MFDVLLVDCPWRYNQRCTHSKTKFGGGVTGQYPTMSDQEILDMGPLVKSVAAKDAALFFWVTEPRQELGLQVMRAWGFKPVTTAFVWVKTNADGTPFTGPGYYTASNIERVVLGIKGKMKPHKRLINQVLLAPHPRYPEGTPPMWLIHPETGEVAFKKLAGKIIHSAKPPEIHHRIAQMYPNARKLELFARQSPEGWQTLGNGVDGRDIREALAVLA